MKYNAPPVSLQDIPLYACCLMAVALLFSLIQQGLQ